MILPQPGAVAIVMGLIGLEFINMTANGAEAGPIKDLVETVDLANALESERFRHFLDQIPIAIVVSVLRGSEHIIYANLEFEKLSRQPAAEIEGKSWDVLRSEAEGTEEGRKLSAAIVEGHDFVGTFRIEREENEPTIICAYSNVIEDDDGNPTFRLVALVDVSAREKDRRAELEDQMREKDTLLQEIQHRVKNNLQMITTLIRLEARNASSTQASAPFDRLAGRIEAIQLLYQSLEGGEGGEIDLGVYLSQIASAVMLSHAVEGVRLDLKVDTYPVSVNVAMPAGLVVNELLTNALKYAFKDHDGGTITLHSLADGNGCRVVVADDGVGLPPGVEWPKRGKLSALIVRSLRENAKAQIEVASAPGRGVRVTIQFTRAAAAPDATQ